ncbi:DUF2914 domain-containing protein [candidate division KSB1 bacterium]|nr:DUF2914 domain-containing protein [candidate division KSB1 bacterium]
MKACFGCLFLLLVLATAALAQQDSLVVAKAEICLDVEDRQPVEAAAVFADTVGQIYCFSIIEGAEDSLLITHKWIRGDHEMAAVPLAVQPGAWRTWSSKRIMKEWTGEWKVDIIAPDGTVLKSVGFEIEATE